MILDGIVKIIWCECDANKTASAEEGEAVPDIKTLRKAFMLLMLLVMNEHLHSTISSFFSPNDKSTQCLLQEKVSNLI